MTDEVAGPKGSELSEGLGLVPERGDGLEALLYRLKNATEEGRHGRLYLEAAAVIERQRAALLDANQICRSAWQIANRIATEYSTNEMGTYFGAFSDRAHESLKRQHETILATGGYPRLEA